MVNGTITPNIPFLDSLNYSVNFGNSSELIGFLLIIILCVLVYKLIKSIISNFAERRKNNNLIYDSQKVKFFEITFNLYNKLWKSLVELKFIGEDLWNRPTTNLILKFQDSLVKTKKEIYENSLLFERKDIEKLLKIIKEFENYQIGKKRLIQVRSTDKFDEDLNIIFNNKKIKYNYENLLDNLENEFRNKIFLNFGQRKSFIQKFSNWRKNRKSKGKPRENP